MRAGASVQEINLYNQALLHAASRGLTYPQKSSIMRSLLSQSQYFGRLAGGPLLALINVNVGIFHCLYVEIRDGLAGNCKP